MKEAKSYLHVSRSTFSLASLRFSHSGSNQHQIDYILFAYKNDEDPQSLKSIYSVKNVPEMISEFINWQYTVGIIGTIDIDIYTSYQIGWSLPSCKSPATISSDQKKPIPMNIFKYRMILQLLWNVWYITAVINVICSYMNLKCPMILLTYLQYRLPYFWAWTVAYCHKPCTTLRWSKWKSPYWPSERVP